MIKDIPEDSTNSFYHLHCGSKVQSQLAKLPVGSIKPQGWLKEYLIRQKNGLTGQLPNISGWLQKENNAWLNPQGEGEHGWEEVPYWLKGYISLAYLLDDEEMIKESHFWIEATIGSQRENGDFGPKKLHEETGDRDYWANMIMLFCLQTYHEYTEDDRIINMMINFFHHIETIDDERFLSGYWDRMRGGDMLYSLVWLYSRTKEEFLIALAEKIHSNTANWSMEADLPNWHNVNIAECFREPATYYLCTADQRDLQAAYNNHYEVRKRYGQVPGGMFGGDENCRDGYSDPRQGVETCGMVEQMLSDEIMVSITADTFWADHCEDVAFNSYAAAFMPDFRSLRYFTCPNMAQSDKENHAPGIENEGPFLMMNPFSSRCCQHNHSHGWPYFCENLFMATNDDGIAAVLYSACDLKAKVKGGSDIHFKVSTEYPFEEIITMEYQNRDMVEFPFYFRIPSWIDTMTIKINTETVQEIRDHKKGFAKIERVWAPGDRIQIIFDSSIKVQEWRENKNSVSISKGPLTYSLDIEEKYVRQDAAATAIGDSKWQENVDKTQWPSFEILPESPWNYGLISSTLDDMVFTKMDKKNPNFPFDKKQNTLFIEAKAKIIKNWDLDQHKLCAPLPQSPVSIDKDQQEENVRLIPMGCARLRISSFPVIAD